MEERQLVFDAHEAGVEAQKGIDHAYRAAKVQQWKIMASHWLSYQPKGLEIVADDLIEAIGLPDEGPGRNNVVGAWFHAQSVKGRINWTGEFRKSERVVRHSNLQRVWEVN